METTGRIRTIILVMSTLMALMAFPTIQGCHGKRNGTGGAPGGGTDNDKYETGSR